MGCVQQKKMKKSQQHSETKRKLIVEMSTGLDQEVFQLPCDLLTVGVAVAHGASIFHHPRGTDINTPAAVLRQKYFCW